MRFSVNRALIPSYRECQTDLTKLLRGDKTIWMLQIFPVATVNVTLMQTIFIVLGH